MRHLLLTTLCLTSALGCAACTGGADPEQGRAATNVDLANSGTSMTDLGSAPKPADDALQDWDPALVGATQTEFEEGEGVLTFRSLSLAGSDVEALMDNIYAWPDEEPPPYEYPATVLELDGKELSFVGYQFPVIFADKKLEVFMLVRDLASCCFGGTPLPDEWIYIDVPEDVDCDYHPYQPVVVTGVLEVIQPPGNDDDGANAYKMTVQAVRKYY